MSKFSIRLTYSNVRMLERKLQQQKISVSNTQHWEQHLRYVPHRVRNRHNNLNACIVEAVSATRQKPGIFECIRQSLLHRRQICTEVCGCILEHLL